MDRRKFLKNALLTAGVLAASPLVSAARRVEEAFPNDMLNNKNNNMHTDNTKRTLFQPSRLGKLTMKNRAWRSATWMALSDESGRINDDIINAYEELAAGGVGAIITGITSVVTDDQEVGEGAKFYDDSFVEGHRRLTDAIHRHDCLAFLQTAKIGGPIDELTTAQVEDLVRQFGDAAARAERAGYDGIQIHAAHFFYLSRFVSPIFNHRTDRYGGSVERRAQILLEILADMRRKTSKGFCITMKINSTDEYPGGVTEDDFLVTSRLMAEAGIDAIEVSANATSRGNIRAGENEAYFLDAASELAAYVATPVILVGGLRSLETINRILADTAIEYVSLSRPLIREPDLIRRWQQGDTAPARCISCNACYNTPGHKCVFVQPR